jgi:hypothetical protein
MTAQIHEMLIYEGEETSMAFRPPLPEGDPRLVANDPEVSELDKYDFLIYSTACWRGYQGTWEIKGGCFYLVAIRGRYKLRSDEPILADWFTGVLRIPRGKLLEYVHMGFGSVYEQELHVRIEAGLVGASRLIDNRGKEQDAWGLGFQNLPGLENRFPGDDEL